MRGLVRFLLVLILVLIVAYLGAWWYAEGRLGLAFQQQMAQIRQAGWTVRHGATSRGTSPLVARFTVADLAVSPPATIGPPPTFTLPSLDLDVRPTSPFTLDVGLPLTWHITMPSGPSFSLGFTAVTDRYQFDPNAIINHASDALRVVDVAMTGMRLDSANTNFTLASIASLTVHATRDPQAGKTRTALTGHETMSGFALSPIFVTLAHLPFSGKIRTLDVDLQLSGPQLPPLAQSLVVPPPGGVAATPGAGEAAAWQRLGPAIHDWAQAGGHGNFALKLGVGPLNGQDHGTFAFDSKVQPVTKSTLDATGVGEFLGDIANAYPAAVSMVSALTTASAPYMVKGPNGAQSLKVELDAANGILTANGKKIGPVPPVVWPTAMPTQPPAPKSP